VPKKKPKCNKPVKPVFHIFCEGAKTEPYYINGYISYFHSEHRNIVIIENTKKNTPVQLVETATVHKGTSNPKDIYWVVFDRESVAKYSHGLHLKARKLATQNNIEIAFSNVCFEIWLLFHLKYSTASYGSCDDLLKNSPLKTLLIKKDITDYNKGLPYLFNSLKDDIETAKTNARRVNEHAIETAEDGKTSPCYLNPYTDVHELFIDIDNFIAKKDSCRKLQG